MNAIPGSMVRWTNDGRRDAGLSLYSAWEYGTPDGTWLVAAAMPDGHARARRRRSLLAWFAGLRDRARAAD